MRNSIKTKVLTAILGVFGLGLAACASDSVTPDATPKAVYNKPSDPYKVAANTPYTPQGYKGQKIIRIALLAPFNSSVAGEKEEALNLKSGAELALNTFSDGKTILFSLDSGANIDSASKAARDALEGGADFILGPLFAKGVEAVAPFARANNATLFSFSTDVTYAGNGVYVLSFLPEDETNRIISYAAQRGIKKLVLLTPDTKYGERVAAQAKSTAAAMGMSIVFSKTYDPTKGNSIVEAANAAAPFAKGLKASEIAYFLPERGAALKMMVKALTDKGANTMRAQFLGTSIWNDDNTLNDSKMFGGWFVATEGEARDKFEKEFTAITNRKATRLAGLGYDAVALIANAAKNGDKKAINEKLLERSSGFVGINGRFRFNDGIIERSMPVLEIGGMGSKIIDAAPGKF